MRSHVQTMKDQIVNTVLPYYVKKTALRDEIQALANQKVTFAPIINSLTTALD